MLLKMDKSCGSVGWAKNRRESGQARFDPALVSIRHVEVSIDIPAAADHADSRTASSSSFFGTPRFFSASTNRAVELSANCASSRRRPSLT
jgi:hypothetical protein